MGPGWHTWKFIISHKIQHSDRLCGGNKRFPYKSCSGSNSRDTNLAHEGPIPGGWFPHFVRTVLRPHDGVIISRRSLEGYISFEPPRKVNWLLHTVYKSSRPGLVNGHQRLMVRHGMMQKSETNTKGGRALKPKPASSWSEPSKLPVHFARPSRRWFCLNRPLCTHSEITCLLFLRQPQQQFTIRVNSCVPVLMYVCLLDVLRWMIWNGPAPVQEESGL